MKFQKNMGLYLMPRDQRLVEKSLSFLFLSQKSPYKRERTQWAFGGRADRIVLVQGQDIEVKEYALRHAEKKPRLNKKKC